MPPLVVKQRESTRRRIMQPLPPPRSSIDWRNWPKSYFVGIFVASLLVPFTFASCGGIGAEVPVYPVTGKVTFNGEPTEGAQVLLHPKGHKLPPNIAPMGQVKADGTFEIGTYEVNDGAPAGDYVATVQWFKVVQTEGGAGRGPNVLPRDYASPETTPLKFTVTDQVNELAIEIKK